MSELSPFPQAAYRPNRPWMEIVLPLYSLLMILLYYRPQSLVPVVNEGFTRSVVWWALWVILGAVGGILALSALFLAFSLVYSVVYLAANIRRILEPQVWVDRRELRFYFGCFLLLCGLLLLAVVRPEAALVSFTLLAGWAPLLWRILV